MGGRWASGWRAALFGRGDRAVAGLIAAGTLALLLATLDDYGMAWDEGFTVEREERLREWFGRVLAGNDGVERAWSPRLSKLESRANYVRLAGSRADSPWSRESLHYYWQFAREEPNGHPPLYALLGLAGWSIGHRFLPPLESYRLGPAVLFALTIGAAYATMVRRYGRIAALLAATGLLTVPRVFAHAHLASYDIPTLSFWLLAAASFERAADPEMSDRRRWAWAALFGVAWGCAAATKFTGWFVPVPMAAWAILYRDRRAARAMAIGLMVAAAVVYATNPTWWADPVAGVRAFLRSNLSREALRPIPTEFLGTVYRFSLPWYNTIVWTAIAVPPATLLLAMLGIGRVVAGRLRDRLGTLLLICWAFFMVLRALPNAPGHDGIRLFLPGFAFLACLAGIGLATVGEWVGRAAGPRAARVAGVLVLVAATGAGAFSTWRYHPLQLSYYNAMIGGLSGANGVGMEPTYYWEAVTPDVRDWLNRHTAEGRTVGFCFPAVTFEYLHRWGLLRPRMVSRSDRPPQWFVVLNRPGHLKYFPWSLGQFLLEHARPVYVKATEAAPDVPLIAIFHGEDAFAANLIYKRPKGEADDPMGGPPPEAPRPARGQGRAGP